MRQLPPGAWRRGGALSRRIIFFCFATEFRKTAEIRKNKVNDNVDILTDQQIVEDRKYWYCVLGRIVSLIITMSKCNIAFRGHRENDSYTDDDRPSSRGNFLEFINLIAKYDHVLENLLKQPNGTTKYLSGSIQKNH